MKPIDVKQEDEERLVKMLNKCKFKAGKPKFKVGDSVRLSKYKTVFEKGYTPNWGTEIFTITKIQDTNPITYKLKDYYNNDVKGAHYEFQMQKVKYPDGYLIEKILKRRPGEILVKWLGMGNVYNQWIKE